MVVFSAWIRSASLYLLFHHKDSRSRTCALSHWMSWPVWSICTAMPLVVWCVLTALLCSLSRTSSVLHVSPMYVLPQLQSTLYTTPFTFSSAGLFFTLVRMVRSVLRDWNTIFTFRSLQDFSMLSLRPRTYGRHSVFGFSSVSSVLSVVLFVVLV